jgi:hypothetical protein
MTERYVVGARIKTELFGTPVVTSYVAADAAIGRICAVIGEVPPELDPARCSFRNPRVSTVIARPKFLNPRH